MPRRFRAALAAALGGPAAALTLTACSSEPPADPEVVLREAKQQLDSADTVRFSVNGKRLPEEGGVLVSARGALERPDSFEGRFRIATSGVAATIEVVSVDGTLYAQVPFTDRFAETDPAELGVSDPAELLHPKHGLSSVLTAATRAETVGQSREGNEVYDEISARLPAELVGDLLFMADTTATVHTTFFVLADSRELRKARFEGPFYEKGTRTTYTVVLDKYDKPVDIEAPD